MAARAYFAICLAAGRLLRLARYSTARIVHEDGECLVLKRRRVYAPVLVSIGVPLLRTLDAGVRVLPQREWEEQERRIYWSLHGRSIRVNAGGVLVLPCLAGRTLAALLEDRGLDEADRTSAIERAVSALADFHRLGLTHGDATAENVLVDLGAGVAHWFDFETVHDPGRPTIWHRADDLRALLATCLMRAGRESHSATLSLVLDVYADEDVTRALADTFASVWRRSLAFHLAQAGISYRCFRQIGRWLRQPPPPLGRS